MKRYCESESKIKIAHVLYRIRTKIASVVLNSIFASHHGLKSKRNTRNFDIIGDDFRNWWILLRVARQEGSFDNHWVGKQAPKRRLKVFR